MAGWLVLGALFPAAALAMTPAVTWSRRTRSGPVGEKDWRRGVKQANVMTMFFQIYL
ncbi:hypothetical protein B0I31_103100 [Saccharothrix carnea]|uniref:Uncharacterized protein n=1 Tax=Saccharothrix carnea TaxID=1280637 RepID=A0A2P8ICZ7_SACCR|nr:hypothetical protein B0I31_103100 [Saccharothrix carnea]